MFLILLAFLIHVVVIPLHSTLDHERLGIREFNIDMVLINTGELSVKIVGLVHLPQIKVRAEVTNWGRLAVVMVLLVVVVVVVLWTSRAVDIIVVVQKVEQRRQIDGVVWEEGHFILFGC